MFYGASRIICRVSSSRFRRLRTYSYLDFTSGSWIIFVHNSLKNCHAWFSRRAARTGQNGLTPAAPPYRQYERIDVTMSLPGSLATEWHLITLPGHCT
ncbi:hypothetical protein PoB_001268400 [Plakobranchus ocellatus]|uniref:Uncharacterized protein n=1 Tax=Plakobranchus ocellatus TaxID=259542 RepID=A0AAV3YVV3_9GAST|nr:hypothetical protein PoB_001268400 [Plakobranchus ocellatus]